MATAQSYYSPTLNVTFKVGDFITAYHSGIHRLTSIELRTQAKDKTDSPVFYYDRIMDGKFNPKKGKNCCDASFCKPTNVQLLNQQANQELSAVTKKYSRAIKILKKAQS
jgi:hypothetical protein